MCGREEIKCIIHKFGHFLDRRLLVSVDGDSVLLETAKNARTNPEYSCHCFTISCLQEPVMRFLEVANEIIDSAFLARPFIVFAVHI